MADEPQEPSEQEPKLRVDEDWKKTVAEEKARLRQQQEHEEQPSATSQPGAADALPEPNIQIFMAGLYTQTMVALGEIENPVTKKRAPDSREARYLIDTIAMLDKKMDGNLTPQEASYVRNILYDLRMRYVNRARAAGSDEGPPES